jgi:hypothetical protein
MTVRILLTPINRLPMKRLSLLWLPVTSCANDSHVSKRDGW